MVTEKVTRKQLRSMGAGETQTVELPNYGAVQSAKQTAYDMQKILGCRFSCNVDKENQNSLTITRYDND